MTVPGYCCNAGEEVQRRRHIQEWAAGACERGECPHLWPSCKGLKDPGRYTLPLRGASVMTWPPEYSTDRTRPLSSSCSGSSMLCTVSCSQSPTHLSCPWATSLQGHRNTYTGTYNQRHLHCRASDFDQMKETEQGSACDGRLGGPHRQHKHAVLGS